jgi:polyisoprenoid-binding protein YceI
MTNPAVSPISYVRRTISMNLRFFAIAIFAFLLPVASAFAQTSTWIIDTKHTQIDFQIRRVPVSNVRGSFSRITGTVIWDENNPAHSSVQVTIPTSSISTTNETRDKNLRSSEFFDVDKYPTMTFKSTAVKGTTGNLQIIGDLTLAGVTRSVKVAVDGPTPPAKNMGANLVIGFSATGIIKRSDFNFAPKFPAAILGDGIKFTIDMEADQ